MTTVYFAVVEGRLFSRGQLKNNFGASPEQNTIKVSMCDSGRNSQNDRFTSR